MIQHTIISPPLLCRGGEFINNPLACISGGGLKHREKQSSQERNVS